MTPKQAFQNGATAIVMVEALLVISNRIFRNLLENLIKMKVKVCGLHPLRDVQLCIDLGVNF